MEVDGVRFIVYKENIKGKEDKDGNLFYCPYNEERKRELHPELFAKGMESKVNIVAPLSA